LAVTDWRLRRWRLSFLALVLFGAYDSYPISVLSSLSCIKTGEPKSMDHLPFDFERISLWEITNGDLWSFLTCHFLILLCRSGKQIGVV